ncbi:unnamed protein product [Tilletia caries]|nr:unnamed protein product [Tilletia caries]
MPSTQYPTQPSSSNFSVSVSSSSRRLLSQPELEHPVNLLLGVVLHRLEEEGRLQKSDLAIRVEEFRAAGRRERVQQGASSSRPTSSSKGRGVQTLSVRTRSEDLLLRMFDRSYQDNGSIDSKATIRLMDILRTTHQTPASPTSSRSSLWGRPNQLSLSELVPEVFGAYHAYDDGFKRPWILMERPRGQVLSDLLSSTSRSAQTLQDRLQLARALARLQAAIWAVSPAPFTCPDSMRAAIPPLSLGRPFVPREEEGLGPIGTGEEAAPFRRHDQPAIEHGILSIITVHEWTTTDWMGSWNAILLAFYSALLDLASGFVLRQGAPAGGDEDAYCAAPKGIG